jgi:NAD(P)-dependent dehydrogenase (short-subunit alcohol dehydrogenase family)
MRLKHKVCVVTGAAQGIGLATALKFAEEGAAVVVCDLRPTVSTPRWHWCARAVRRRWAWR